MQPPANGTIDDEVVPKQKISFLQPAADSSPTLETLCALLHSRVYEFLDRSVESELLTLLQQQTRRSLVVVNEALRNYGFEEIALSYNGGKDCLVLLILYLVGLYSHFYPSASSSSSNSAASSNDDHRVNNDFPTFIPSIYIQTSNPFPEVTEFVETSAADYHLSLLSSKKDMKQAFQEYLDSHPNVKAIFVGTRRTDPHGAKLTSFDRTDRGWPDFMRIHPVIDWHYREIWAFLRHFDIPYCSLYDLGYTSLGGTGDTFPNPKLKTATGPDATHFRPAFELMEDDDERLGRDR